MPLLKKRKKIFLNSKALNSTNQEQIIEESKVGPNSDLVPFYVLFREVENKKKTFLNSKALKNTNQEQIIEESKVRPNLDLVTFLCSF